MFKSREDIFDLSRRYYFFILIKSNMLITTAFVATWTLSTSSQNTTSALSPQTSTPQDPPSHSQFPPAPPLLISSTPSPSLACASTASKRQCLGTVPNLGRNLTSEGGKVVGSEIATSEGLFFRFLFWFGCFKRCTGFGSQIEAACWLWMLGFGQKFGQNYCC